MSTDDPDPMRPDADEAAGQPPLAKPAPARRLPGYTTEELARHSVFNEMNIFPGRADEVIQTDWRCSACGYNLRGLMTGQRCPECGSIELYRPPPPGEVSYATWYEERKRQCSNLMAFFVLLGVVVASGPFAVVGSVLTMWMPKILGPIVIGPAVEEVMKIALILLIVETRPYLVRRHEEIGYAALAGALGFAAIENLLYLNVYVPNPSLELTMWRWTICVVLHVVCSLIAARGVAAVWRATEEQKREPMTQLMFRPLISAIALHASYNIAITLADATGYSF